MSWFFFALICFLGWGLADLFYKKSSDGDDRVSHLKITVWVGLLMGVVSVVLLLTKPIADNGLYVLSLKNILSYSPASLGYILSMVIGYAGMRYLEISVISPVQNASGAFSAIAILAFFAVKGNLNDALSDLGILGIAGTCIIVVGIVLLGVFENKLVKTEVKDKHRLGVLALIFPLLYCVFDTLGTAADGIILDENSGLGLGETDVLILYGITFLFAGIISWFVILFKTKKAYNPFDFKSEWPKAAASACEQFGQIFYVFAMAKNPVLAAPMIASYCICSVILSRLFLKEKLDKPRLIAIITVIVGIVILGFTE